MARLPIRFAMQSNPGRYHADGPLRLINCYTEERGAEGKGEPIHYAIPGLAAWQTLTYGGPGQGLALVDDKLIAVSNRGVYLLDVSETATAIGGFLGEGPLSVALLGQTPQQLVMCAGGAVAVVQNGALSLLSDASLPGANSVAACRNYAFYTRPDGYLVASDLSDATTIDPLSVAASIASQNGLVKAFSFNDALVVFGPEAMEWWSDAGATPFPFEPIPGTSAKIGCAAPSSVAEVALPTGGTGMAWVANDNTVRLAAGYSGTIISHEAVSTAIAGTADRSTITATVHAIPGHVFYVLNGPDWTWAYDVTKGRWHERQSYGMSRWRVMSCIEWRGETVALDADSGALYRVRTNAYDEAGHDLVWTARALVTAYPDRLTLNKVWLDVIPGQGLNTTDVHNSDPKIMLRWSRDNGVVWGPVRMMSAGKIGESNRRVSTFKLGTAREDGFVLEASMSAAVVKGLTGAAGEFEKVPG